jgi:protein-disulfide isomerase
MAVRARLAAALVVLAVLAGAAQAEEAPPVADQVMTIGPLPDIAQGAASAPVTIVEYASMTCTHCAAFHTTTWPQLKAKYVETGRVRFILREFPLDPLAAAAFMLARCAGPDKRNLLIERLFAQQKSWAFVDKPVEPLLGVAQTVGLGQAEFDACLRDEPLYRQVNESRERAAKAFGVDSTPTFFINGRKLTGELSLAEFDQAIEQAAR